MSLAIPGRRTPQSHGGDFGPYSIQDLQAREDEGKDLELEDGWLVELPSSNAHALAASKLRRYLETLVRNAGSAAFVDGGRCWEITTPAGVRKPDVFMVSREAAEASIVDRSPVAIPGRALLLAVEVISPHSRSERCDRVRKPSEYAGLGIPQYWVAEFTPRPRVQLLVLDDETGSYRFQAPVKQGSVFEATIHADVPIEVSFDPGIMTEF